MKLLLPLLLSSFLVAVVSLEPPQPSDLLERQVELGEALVEDTRSSDGNQSSSMRLDVTYSTTPEVDHPVSTVYAPQSTSPPSSTSLQIASHHAHGAALPSIDEEIILMTHDPDPLAYWRYDQENDAAHPTLLVFHVALASLSFFALLPIS